MDGRFVFCAARVFRRGGWQSARKGLRSVVVVGARSGSEAPKGRFPLCLSSCGASLNLTASVRYGAIEYLRCAKYFAFRRGARLRCIASGYVSVLATKHQRKRQAPNKKRASVENCKFRFPLTAKAIRKTTLRSGVDTPRSNNSNGASQSATQ